MEEDKRINQSFTKNNNQADVQTADAYKTIKCHTNKNQSKSLSYSPEINYIVSTVYNNIHHSSRRTKNSKRKYNNTSSNNPRVNIENNKDKSKIGIKTSNNIYIYIEDSEKFNSNGTYDSE